MGRQYYNHPFEIQLRFELLQLQKIQTKLNLYLQIQTFIKIQSQIMTYNLTIPSQPQQLTPLSLQKEQQSFLPSSSSLVLIPNHNKLIYHGYPKSKPNQQTKPQSQQQSQQAKPKKKFQFKVTKDKQPPKNITQTTSKLYIYTSEQPKWTQLEIKGKLPFPRENQQVLILNHNLFLMYGGKNIENQKLLNDLHILNLQTLTWKKLFSIEGPSPSENNLLIKLNQTKIALVSFKHVWTFQFKDVKWELSTNELPGGLWENMQLTFDGFGDLQKEILVSAVNVTEDIANPTLLVFTVSRQTHKINCYMIRLNANDKEITKVKITGDLSFSLESLNVRSQIGCYIVESSERSKEGKRVLFMVKKKDQFQLILTTFDHNSRELKILIKKLVENGLGDMRVMGQCYDLQNESFYYILSDVNNTKQKSLRQLKLTIQHKSPPLPQPHNIKQRNPSSGYLNSSQIQSIPQESQQSSMIGLIAHQNERYEDFQGIQSEVFASRNPMRSSEKLPHSESRLTSNADLSPSVQSDDVESQEDESYRNSTLVDQSPKRHKQKQPIRNQNLHLSPMDSSRPNHDEIQNNSSSFPEEQHLQSTLERILVFEHIKRQKLQDKSMILQQSIKSSETLSKLLSKYATHNEKNKHIEQVKYLKQELQAVWNKQTFYRKQIHNHFLSTQAQLMSRHHAHDETKSKVRQGRIDMRKLLQKHNLPDEE